MFGKFPLVSSRPTCSRLERSSFDEFTSIPELLGLVFRLATRDDESPNINNLMAVCSRWHGVAVATPRLWTKIRLRMSGNTTERLSSHLSLWLERSRACPISVFLHNTDPRTVHGQVAPLMQLLSPHAGRLQQASFKFAFLEDLALVIGTLKTMTLPILRSLAFEYTRVSTLVVEQDLRIDVSHAPRLESLRLIATDHVPVSLRLPPSLCELECQYFEIKLEASHESLRTLFYKNARLSTDIFTHLVARLQNIEVLELHCNVGPPDDGMMIPNIGNVVLPFLRKLFLDGYAAVLFPMLTTPNLKILGFGNDISDGYYDWEGTEELPFYLQVVRFLHRSQCTQVLTNLSLLVANVSEQQLIFIIKELPNLEFLYTMCMNEVSDRILCALTLPNRRPSDQQRLVSYPILGLCPRLKYVDFELPLDLEGVTVNAMIALITSRLPADSSGGADSSDKALEQPLEYLALSIEMERLSAVYRQIQWMANLKNFKLRSHQFGYAHEILCNSRYDE